MLSLNANSVIVGLISCLFGGLARRSFLSLAVGANIRRLISGITTWYRTWQALHANLQANRVFHSSRTQLQSLLAEVTHGDK